MSKIEEYKVKVKDTIKTLISSGELLEAEKVLCDYENIIQNDVEIFSIKAVILIMNNKFEKAEKTLIKALNNYGYNFDLTYNLAYLYALKGMDSKAYYYYSKSLIQCKDMKIKTEITEIMGKLYENKDVRHYLKRKKIVIFAQIFPPLGGSGVQRTLKFVKYLREFNWEPIVVTVGNTCFNYLKDTTLNNEIPSDINIIRIDEKLTFNADEVQSLLNNYNYLVKDEALMMEYINLINEHGKKRDNSSAVNMLLTPDNSSFWAMDVINDIDDLLDFNEIDVIYTTSGPYSDHIIGYFLKEKYNRIWITDFRDEWTNNPYVNFDHNKIEFKLIKKMEENILRRSDKIITTTPIAEKNYINLLDVSKDKIVTITNGYDENDFKNIIIRNENREKFKITHNGMLYMIRTPETFLSAIKNLIDKNLIDKNLIEINFSYTENQELWEKYVKDNNLHNVVNFNDYMSHEESLDLSINSDLLLLIVGPGEKNKGVYTGKVFEYLRMNKPILALSPKKSIVENLLIETSSGENFDFYDIQGIENYILKSYTKWTNNYKHVSLKKEVYKYERKELTYKLSCVLDESIKQKNLNDKKRKIMERDLHEIIEKNKQDKTSTIMSFINYVEKKFQVNEWIIDNIHIWPLIRIPFAYTASQSKNNNSEDISDTCNSNINENINKELQDEKIDYKKNIDTLFLIRTNQSRILLDDKWYDRFRDPLLDLCKKNDISTLALEYCDNEEYKSPTYNTTIKIQNDINNFFNKKNNIKLLNYKLKNFEDFLYLLKVFFEKSGYKSRKFSIEELIYNVRTLKVYCEYFKTILNKVNPKVAFVVCYYNSFYEYGFSLACKEFGIPIVDIQHGRNDDLHFAYGRWNNIPEKGYELLPNIFWSWNNEDVNTINKWNRKCSKYHYAIKGGNPWIDKCMDKNFELLCNDDRKVKEALDNDEKIINILYTHQYPNEIPKKLLEAIKKSPENFKWWVRFHPRASKTIVERDVKLLKSCKNINIEYTLASELNLISWLKYIDVHITEFSSSVIEAIEFGVPTVLIGSKKLCENMYFNEIKKGYAILADENNGIIDSIKKQSTKIKEMKKLTKCNIVSKLEIIRGLLLNKDK